MLRRCIFVLLVIAFAFTAFYGCGPNNKVRLRQALANAKQNQTPYAEFRLSDISARQITSEEKLAQYSDKLVVFSASYMGRAPTHYDDGEYTVHLVSEFQDSPNFQVKFLEDSQSPLYGESWRQFAPACTMTGCISRPMTIWAIIQYTSPPSFWAKLGTGIGKAALSGAVSGTQQGLAKRGYSIKPGGTLDTIKAAADAPAGEENGVIEFYAQKFEFKQSTASVATPSIDGVAAYISRGDAFLGRNQTSQAVQEYLDGWGIDPEYSAPIFGLAEAYWLIGNKGRALHYYKLFLTSSDPNKEKWRVDKSLKILQDFN